MKITIDCADAGTQVFEADTPEALIGQLSEAHVHATRKIRELSAELKESRRLLQEICKRLEALIESPSN